MNQRDRQPERVRVTADLECGCQISTGALSSSPIVNGHADELRCGLHGLQRARRIQLAHELTGAPW
jgi:hypothetical protein